MSTGNAVAVRPIAAPVALVDDWTQARIDFVLKTYCAGAPEPIANAFLHIARKRRLSPEEKHIYLVQYGSDWTIQTGIDGFRLIADRSGLYAGSDKPVFSGEPMTDDWEAEVTVWKIVQGVRCPFTGAARWAEFLPPNPKQQFMWRRMPRVLLAKCAEAQALRKAFPADLSGIYVDAEMMQADPTPQPTTVRETKPKATPARAIPAQTAKATADGMATPQQTKSIIDIGKRKKLGELDIELLLGGEGWEAGLTDSEAKDWIAWLQSAKPDDINTALSKAAQAVEDAPDDDAAADTDMATIDAAVGRAVAP